MYYKTNFILKTYLKIAELYSLGEINSCGEKVLKKIQRHCSAKSHFYLEYSNHLLDNIYIYIRDYFRPLKNSFAEKLLGFKYRWFLTLWNLNFEPTLYPDSGGDRTGLDTSYGGYQATTSFNAGKHSIRKLWNIVKKKKRLFLWRICVRVFSKIKKQIKTFKIF